MHIHNPKIWILAAVLMGTTLPAWASCDVVDGATKVPFAGKSLSQLLVEKRSLTLLNKAFPDLNVIERTFKGEIRTCSICSEKYVLCRP